MQDFLAEKDTIKCLYQGKHSPKLCFPSHPGLSRKQPRGTGVGGIPALGGGCGPWAHTQWSSCLGFAALWTNLWSNSSGTKHMARHKAINRKPINYFGRNPRLQRLLIWTSSTQGSILQKDINILNMMSVRKKRFPAHNQLTSDAICQPKLA